MGLLDMLKGGIDTPIDTASKIAGDRGSSSSTQSKKDHSPSKGGSKRK